jgi:hypothetical protein
MVGKAGRELAAGNAFRLPLTAEALRCSHFAQPICAGCNTISSAEKTLTLIIMKPMIAMEALPQGGAHWALSERLCLSFFCSFFQFVRIFHIHDAINMTFFNTHARFPCQPLNPRRECLGNYFPNFRVHIANFSVSPIQAIDA